MLTYFPSLPPHPFAQPFYVWLSFHSISILSSTDKCLKSGQQNKKLKREKENDFDPHGNSNASTFGISIVIVVLSLTILVAVAFLIIKRPAVLSKCTETTYIRSAMYNNIEKEVLI